MDVYKEYDIKNTNPRIIEDFLTDISSRKEFNNYTIDEDLDNDYVYGYKLIKNPLIYPSQYILFNSQLFIKNFINPNTPTKRLLLKWQVGTGKTKAIGAIAHEFVKQYKLRSSLGENTPHIFVIAFTQDNIQNELLKDPYFGFTTLEEIIELQALRVASNKNNASTEDIQKYTIMMGSLRRRLSDKNRGGYYSFFGYKSFANKLFIITREGELKKFNITTYISSITEEKSYTEIINLAVKEGYITINYELLESMRNALLICDEIQDVYNIIEINNYGIAIQYILDTLGDNAPKCIFMSATPVTGAASEVVDLLNLLVPINEMKQLVPKGYINRSDLFEKFSVQETEDEEMYTVSKLKPGALDLITKLSIGRVSFLLDSNVELYPKRIIMGESIKDIPYLKFITCPMSDLHEKAFYDERHNNENSQVKTDLMGFNVNAYCLNDLVFPDNNFSNSDITNIFVKMPDEKRNELGVTIEKIAPYGNIVSGSFLRMPELAKYSSKYAKMLEIIKNIIANDIGKIMIYHNRVRVSGVLCIQEVLRMNGVLDEFSIETEDTLCNICGDTKRNHKSNNNIVNIPLDMQEDLYRNKPKNHKFTPVRFLIINAEVSTHIEQLKSKFNAYNNLYGHEFRILIGSKLMAVSHEVSATRHQLIMSFPINFPIAIQIMGRVIRSKSHNNLPKDLWQSHIYFLVTVRKDGSMTPELKKYFDKGQEYLVIQEVDRAMSLYAVDGFMNYEKIKTVMAIDGNINILDYKPLLGNTKALYDNTFNAYDMASYEIEILINIIRLLFQARPIWSYKDLTEAILKHSVKGINYNKYDPKNINIALHRCKTRHVWLGHGIWQVIYIGGKDQYYLYTEVINDVRQLDIECYLPQRQNFETVSINLTTHLKTNLQDRNFRLKLAEFVNILNSSYPELILTEFNSEFHILMLKKLVLGENIIGDNDKKALNIYRRFKILVNNNSIANNLSNIVWFITSNSIYVYDGNKDFKHVLYSEYKIGKRNKENNIIIGIIQDSDSLLGEPSFKLKPPNTVSLQLDDYRKMIKGLACKSITHDNVAKLVVLLRKEVEKKSLNSGLEKLYSLNSNSNKDKRSLFNEEKADEVEKLDYKEIWLSSRKVKNQMEKYVEGGDDDGECLPCKAASEFTLESKIQKGEMSTYSLCMEIKLLLLRLEEHSREQNMVDSTRYIYLFHD